MIKNILAIQFVLGVFTTIVFSSCKTDEVSPTERNRNLLKSGTWSVSYVKVDGVDRSDLFKGLKLTFSDQEVTAENGGPIWGTTLSWLFTDNTAREFTLGSVQVVSINELTSSSLNITLIWDKTTLDGGRLQSVEGLHEFQFVK